MTYKTFLISEIFDIERGKSKYTKSYGNRNNGNYPVYSASNTLPLTFIDTYDYDGTYLTWATNGFAGFIKVIDGQFSVNGDRAVMKLKREDVNLHYIRYKLEPILRELAKGRKGDNGKNEFTKVYPSMVEYIKIDIPIDINEKCDLDIQKNIANRYILIKEIKERIKNYKTIVENISVNIETDNQQFKYIPISRIFDLSTNRNNSRLTKSYIEENKGEYPVYSANTKQNGILGYMNSFDYDIECVQITTNGYAGTVFYRQKHKFSINADARLYIPKTKNLDSFYLSFELQRLFNQNNFDWEYKPTIARTKNLKIKIPITSSGEFDLQKQKEIAEKYRKIEEIKNTIKLELERIENIKVDIGL